LGGGGGGGGRGGAGVVVVVEERERGWRVRQEVFSRQGQRGGCRGVLVVGAGGPGGAQGGALVLRLGCAHAQISAGWIAGGAFSELVPSAVC